MTTYQRMPFIYWRFEWNLNLIAYNPWRQEPTTSEPYPSPATSGGIYAIRKEWWDHLEFFDPKMIRWGGDHVEASHKVWRCGGRIEIHPCSRVGHWFRSEEERPYSVQVPDVVRNYKRLAEVWLDGHKESFYKVKPEARNMPAGELQQMQESRERLKGELPHEDFRKVRKRLEEKFQLPGEAPGGSFLTPLNGSMPWVPQIEIERPGLKTQGRSASEKRLAPLAPLVEHTGSLGSTRPQPVLAQSLAIPEGCGREPEVCERCVGEAIRF
eukprot:g19288.t1